MPKWLQKIIGFLYYWPIIGLVLCALIAVVCLITSNPIWILWGAFALIFLGLTIALLHFYV